MTWTVTTETQEIAHIYEWLQRFANFTDAPAGTDVLAWFTMRDEMYRKALWARKNRLEDLV